jgi:hypothetical protein
MMESQTMQFPGKNIKKQSVYTSKIRFVYATYKAEFPAPQKTKIIYIIKTSLLMILGKNNAVCSENYANLHKCAVRTE